jgi:hypothetical protein
VLGASTAFVGSLWALHTYLALTNQTTWELLRRCVSPPASCESCVVCFMKDTWP